MDQADPGGGAGIPGIAPVAIQRASPATLREDVAAALEAVGWRDLLGPAPSVLVKPNLGWDLYVPGAVTDAGVLAALTSLLAEDGREVILIEADQVLVDVEVAARRAGIPQLTRHPRVRWHNLSRHPFTHRPPRGGVLDGVPLPEIIGSRPLITVPVMKTHAKTTISGALKNQWGLLPVDRHRLHPQLDAALPELYALAPPTLCLMDATTALEGDGPKSGAPRQVGHLLASASAPCLDWVAAEIMGFDPRAIPHLRGAAPPELRALADIPLVGQRPHIPPFRAPGHNLVSRVEGALRGSALHRLVFDSPVFDACCAGARGWYHLWYHYGPGRRLRAGGR